MTDSDPSWAQYLWCFCLFAFGVLAKHALSEGAWPFSLFFVVCALCLSTLTVAGVD